MTRFLWPLGLVCATAPAFADIAPIGLDEALIGATAIAVMDQGFLFVSKTDAAYVCAVNVSAEFFLKVAAKDFDGAKAAQPAAICVPAFEFELLGKD